MPPEPPQATTTDSAMVVWSPDLLGYRWSPTHPMNPIRLALTMELAQSLGVLDGVDVHTPVRAGDDELRVLHRREYVEAVRQAGAYVSGQPCDGPFGQFSAEIAERIFGLGTADNPIFGSMHQASALLVGGSLAAADAIATGRVRRAVNIGGGMHHAMPGRASGFCVYNDAALAISRLLDAGYERIAYLDIDAHHGDGVERAFAADPRVLTISLHQHPDTLFPGTGYAHDIGTGQALGSAVNVALPPGIDDRLWLRAFHAVVPSLLASFAPHIVVSQCGVDSHRIDPLTDLSLSIDGQRAAIMAMRDLADTYADGRWLALGGGGYGVTDVVPRIWTHLLAAVVGRDIDPATPTPLAWRDSAAAALLQVHGEYATTVDATTMSDNGDTDYHRWEGNWGELAPPGISLDTQARVDAAILATRSAVWPLHGLTPEDPRD